MADILSEIAKHLPFRMQIIALLSCRRCREYIRIYDVPERVQLEWNDDRIKLFPDIKGLRFAFIKTGEDEATPQFDPAIIANMKLVSFKFFDTKQWHRTEDWIERFGFDFLKGMRTLKQLFFYTGNNRFKYIDDVLKTLDLEYFDHIISAGAESFLYVCESNPTDEQRLFGHMKLKAFNYLERWQTWLFAETMKYAYISDHYSESETQDLHNIHTLTFGIGDVGYIIPRPRFDYQYLSKFKIHRLKLRLSFRNEEIIDYSFMAKDMKIYELIIDGRCNLPPIEYIISNRIKRLYVPKITYSDDQLEQLRFNGVDIYPFIPEEKDWDADMEVG